MNKLNVKYKDRKDSIYHFYSHFKKLDVDSIEEANDHIVDIDLKKEHFDNPLEEFYNIVSMCLFMIENNLYDEYFFETYKEILEEYNSGDFDEYFLDSDDKVALDKDVDEINDHLKKDEQEVNYYNNLSQIYDNKLGGNNEK